MTSRDTLLDFLEKERLNLDYILRYASACSKNIETIRNQVYSSGDLSEKECTVILDHFDLYKNSMGELRNYFKLYDSALCATLNHLKPSRIKWIPENKGDLKMKFKEGDSPWLIYLIYSDPIDVSCYLHDLYMNGTLEPVSKISKMDFVCCNENNQIQRAVVLDVGKDPRIKTFYFVDTGVTKIVDHMNIYEIPDAFFDVPAQCMQCIFNNSLTDEDRVSWPPEMGEVFQKILSSSDLVVNVVAEKDSFPPVFLVDITAVDEQPRSLNDWLSNRLLPHLERLEPGVDVADFLHHLQQEGIFDPFYSEPECFHESLISRLGNALFSFFNKIFNPIPFAVGPYTKLIASSETINYFSVHQKAEPLVGEQLIRMGTASGAIARALRYKPVMRNELRNFSTHPDVGSVMVIRILRSITMTTAYVLMPIKFSMFDGDKRSWSQLNEDLNYAATIESYEDFIGKPVENELVIVKSRGGLFRRAKVISLVSDTLVDVFYIDHGYSESVELPDLKIMLQKFMKTPAQAVKTTFDFNSGYKPISDTSVVLVKVLKYQKVEDEIELTVKVCV